ncbi:MAG: molybdenum cofactor biosynthesis protein MoaE [Armatimonadetes bacterium]|nr:molybdenum cofactor biosynthesis protein MoaE [Armatimonadota bacterium]
MVTLTTEPLDPRALEVLVDDPTCGALGTFLGKVRNHHRGRPVDHLEYEAFEPMAVERIEAILEECAARWELGPMAVAHRLGRLEIGDVAVVVCVGSAHRDAALAACGYIMDRIKDDVPIFKHETWADGTSEWVGPEEAEA